MKYSIEFQNNTKRTSLFLRGIKENLRHGMQGRVQQTGNMMLDAVQREIRTFAKEPSGELEQSYSVSAIVRSRDHTEIRVSSRAPHAGIYESGGVIKPKKAGSLVVPLTARARAVSKKGPRFFPGKLFVPKGGRTLAQKGGPGGGITHHFALVKRVQVRPRHYLTKAMASVSNRIQKLYRQTLDDALTKAAQGAR